MRYGIPWRFSGHEVKVREVNGFVEIYHEKQLIVRHQKQYRSRMLVMCENQYANLSTAQGYAYPKPQGIQVPVQDVEVRSLDVYDASCGGGRMIELEQARSRFGASRSGARREAGSRQPGQEHVSYFLK